jgi:hypothetical protein
MILAFQSREFGFGFRYLHQEEWDIVDEYRSRGVNKFYIDRVAATAVLIPQVQIKQRVHWRNTVLCCFVEYFEYGVNKKGY